ncbi:hypothetical protein AGMMS49941_13360 [Deferribacterales bacterium]|nr:hypothetical protein AGMMS49941_13360 [Deferribacterales bacterium]
MLDISIVPVFLKAGWDFIPFKKVPQLALGPVLGAGMVFASVNHYETAIAMLLDKKTQSSNRGFFVHAGAELSWSFNELWIFPPKAVSIYSGLGSFQRKGFCLPVV